MQWPSGGCAPLCQSLLKIDIIDLDDHAVDLIVKILAHGFKGLEPVEHLGKAEAVRISG